MRHAIWVSLVFVICSVPTIAHGQTATYHLHKEASTTTGLFQLSVVPPDSTSTAIQTVDLKNQPTGEYLIKQFDTAVAMPVGSMVIPTGSTVSFTLWMKKTATWGTLVPRGRVKLNNASGTQLCQADGAALGTSPANAITFSCQTTANVTLSSTDRVYLWVGANVTQTAGNHSVKGELDIEGSSSPQYDSQITIPFPVPPPTITSVTPTIGSFGESVSISGNNFGPTDRFNGVIFCTNASTCIVSGEAGTVTGWSATTITAKVPDLAISGPVYVSVYSDAGPQKSNNVTFTVPPPQIQLLTPSAGLVGQSVTIGGSYFGTTPGTSTVTFNGTDATANVTTWSTTSIQVTVPNGATTGSVVVTTSNGQASNGVTFTVGPPPHIDSIDPASGPVGQVVTISGSYFGDTQGTSSIGFNGTAATPTSWSATSITVPVPPGATSGVVVVTVGDKFSNGVNFIVAPHIRIASVTPSVIPGNTATQVTVTAQVGVAPTLLPSSISLYRRDPQSQQETLLASMHDDGANGDALLGDNVFTAVITFNQSPAVLYLNAAASYSNLTSPVFSDVVRLLVQDTTTAPEQALATLATLIQQNDINGALGYFVPSPKTSDFLPLLNANQRSRLSAALQSLTLVSVNGDVRVYRASWVEADNTTSQVEIGLTRDELGHWVIFTW